MTPLPVDECPDHTINGHCEWCGYRLYDAMISTERFRKIGWYRGSSVPYGRGAVF
ncbi:hypothetical protein [uncultured Ruminococcus sp.]|uniref:hypothetical protein n=1 Tax=uncultured Ruminococcus sp. TaxID=165186 RepID=UPI0029304661|nr:hypothetical protein [uncultured Ruminococcus sp.]